MGNNGGGGGGLGGGIDNGNIGQMQNMQQSSVASSAINDGMGGLGGQQQQSAPIKYGTNTFPNVSIDNGADLYVRRIYAGQVVNKTGDGPTVYDDLGVHGIHGGLEYGDSKYLTQCAVMSNHFFLFCFWIWCNRKINTNSTSWCCIVHWYKWITIWSNFVVIL